MKNFIYELYNGIKSKYQIFTEFVIETDYKSYIYWKHDVDNKKLYVIFIEWFFDRIVTNVIIGTMISFAIPYLNWYQCTVGYWLSLKLLEVVFEKKDN